MAYNSDRFTLVRWEHQYPKNKSIGPKSESDIHIKPLIIEKNGQAVGLMFRWVLRIFCGKQDVLSFITEENFIIDHPDEEELKKITLLSYARAKTELHLKNKTVGLNASLFPFDKYTIDYPLLLSYFQQS